MFYVSRLLDTKDVLLISMQASIIVCVRVSTCKENYTDREL